MNLSSLTVKPSFREEEKDMIDVRQNLKSREVGYNEKQISKNKTQNLDSSIIIQGFLLCNTYLPWSNLHTNKRKAHTKFSY